MSHQRDYSIEFFETAHGDKPVLRWIREDLSVRQRRVLGYAMLRLLQRYGVGVCGTEFGRQLGGGLFEFRLRLRMEADGDSGLLRVFCHAEAERTVVLLGGYDKAKHPGRRRQEREIQLARQRLAEHLRRRRPRGSKSPGLDVQ